MVTRGFPWISLSPKPMALITSPRLGQDVGGRVFSVQRVALSLRPSRANRSADLDVLQNCGGFTTWIDEWG